MATQHNNHTTLEPHSIITVHTTLKPHNSKTTEHRALIMQRTYHTTMQRNYISQHRKHNTQQNTELYLDLKTLQDTLHTQHYTYIHYPTNIYIYTHHDVHTSHPTNCTV